MIPKIRFAHCKQALDRWSRHDAGRLGAALAYYSLLSLAPLLIFVVATVAVVFGQAKAQAAILQEVRDLVGPQGAAAVASLLHNARYPSSGLLAGCVGIVTLLFGASGVFTELRDGLDTAWDLKAPDTSNWKTFAKTRLFAFGMVLAIGFLLLVSLTASAAIATTIRYFSQLIPFPAPLLEVLNFVISIYFIAALFALIFRYVPKISFPFRVVWQGALFTAILFTIGKVLLGIYLGMASVGSAYGAAGSLVAVVVWVYYSAQIFYYGAEFTFVQANAQAAAQGRVRPPDLARTAPAR